jgi:hypothetical protein
VNNDNHTKEIRKVKEGLRNGKTLIIDVDTKKTLRKESYKNGKLVE